MRFLWIPACAGMTDYVDNFLFLISMQFSFPHSTRKNQTNQVNHYAENKLDCINGISYNSGYGGELASTMVIDPEVACRGPIGLVKQMGKL